MSNSKYRSSASYQFAVGFTLIEVLVALVVLAVGMTAVIQFQNSLLNTVSESEKRAMATQVAEEIIEMVKAFESPASLGDVSLPDEVSVSYGTGDVTFKVEVNNPPKYLDVNLSPVSSVAASILELNVKVYPKDGASDESTVELNTYIGRIAPDGSPLAGGFGIGGSSAVVSYNPGLAPDVISIDLGNDTSVETSKPLPELEQKNTQGLTSTLVAFETVRYNSDGRVITEDFVTANCNCKLSGVGNGLPPSYTKYDADTKNIVVKYPTGLDFVSKAVGVSADDGQSYLCDACCRDHHDASDDALTGTDFTEKYRWYWNSAVSADGQPVSGGDPAFRSDGDHWHYSYNSSTGAWVPASGADASYLENCRFKRVDGIYRLMQDWKMVDITVMPRNYLASGAVGQELYKNYVVSVAEDMLARASTGLVSFGEVRPSVAKPSGRNLISDAGEMGSVSLSDVPPKLAARAIYFDPLTSTAVQQIAQNKSNDASWGWLERIPFYEVNTTKLSEWFSEDETKATVDSDPVVKIVSPDTDYYGSYFRAIVHPQSTGITSIVASTAISNTGLVGHRSLTEDGYIWTDSFFDGDGITGQLSDSIQVEIVDGGLSSTVTISGYISCNYFKNNDAENDPTGVCNGSKNIVSSLPSITVVSGSVSYPCENDDTANYINGIDMDNDSGTFSCQGIPVSTSNTYSVTLASTSNAYTVYKASLETPINRAASKTIISSAESSYSFVTVVE